MRIIHLCLVFLFVRRIKNAYHSTSGSGDRNLENWPNSNLRPKSPSGSSPNPCDETGITNGVPNADLACHKECLALRAEVYAIYKGYSNYDAMQYLYDNCGMVTQGRCSTATSTPTCWCHTPDPSKNQWSRRPLFNCRGGIHIMYQFTKALTHAGSEASAKNTIEAVHMQQQGGSPDRTRPPSEGGSVPKRRRIDRPRRGNTGILASCCGCVGGSDRPESPEDTPLLPPQQEEDFNTKPDGEKEGDILCTDVLVDGDPVRVLVDTGADFSIIHDDYVDSYAPIGNQGSAQTNQKFKITGVTNIKIEVRKGVVIRVKGYITDRKYRILLGTDFLVTHGAKINIPDRQMTIKTGDTTVTMAIKFRGFPNLASMLTSDLGTYTSLQILAFLNGQYTRIVIDTGSNITFVTKTLVNEGALRKVATTCSFGGDKPVRFLGKTYVNLQIESWAMPVSVLVPDFIPPQSCLVGNDFNKNHVEFINYESKEVTLRYQGPSGYSRVVTPAYVFRNQ